MKSAFVAAYFFAFFTPFTSAFAEDATKLQTNMNGSDICSPLSFDGKQIADHFPLSDAVKLALQAFNTKVAWDKNFHEVSEFTVKDGNTSIKAELGCQPSPEGAGAKLLKIVGVGVDQLELKDSMSCSGPSASITCTLSGEIGKVLGEATALTTKMQDLANKSM